MKILIPPADLDVVGLGSVKENVPIEVSDELAGHAPDPRREDAMLELNDAIARFDHLAASKLREELIDLDMGVGLLAQGWTEATASQIAKASAESTPASTAAANDPPASKSKRQSQKEIQS